jgi:phosphoglycolate phosphatase-like HAD superfamily hydrolase
MDFVKLTEEQIKDDPEQQLKGFKRTKDFLIAIDTDGCVTDNMNGKHMLIFQPQYMEFYQLWSIESYFREVSEYYNLFSVDRGCNRFLAVQYTLKAFYNRKDVQNIVKDKGLKLPAIEPLNDYIAYCEKNKLGLGNPSLERYLSTQPTNLYLHKLLGWSEAVNRTFPFVKIPPFDNVKESLEIMARKADVIIVSQTPYEDLVNFWESNGLLSYIKTIAGQEMGKKGHHIELVKKAGGYADTHTLMLGDADGDLKAVKQNNGLFYPVPAGYENQAWQNFPGVFENFIIGNYAGEIEQKLLNFFSKVLLKRPPWEQKGYDHVTAYREKQEIRKSLHDKLTPDVPLLVL